MATTSEDITKLLDQIIERYKPGGAFGKPEEALLQRAKTKSLAETAQGLVSSGLSGTTAGIGAGQKWEEEIGMPARLKLEDIRAQRLAEAMAAKAGYLQQKYQTDVQAQIERNRLQYQADQAMMERNRQNRLEADAWLDQWMQKGRIGGGRSYGARRTTGGTVGNPADFSNTPTTPYGISSTPTIPMAQGYGPQGPGTFTGGGQLSLREQYRKFKLKNPYYMRGFEVWSRGKKEPTPAPSQYQGIQSPGPSPSGNPWGYAANPWG